MKDVRAFAVIPAAGMGKRMGASINKQYLLLKGKPIVAHTLQLFQDSPAISGIILVIPADEIPYCREEVVERFSLSKVIEIVPGGKERQHSVMNGLSVLKRYAGDEDVVVIHDGVRPFIDEKMLQESIALASEGSGALTGVPVKDTIKVVENGFVIDTPDRSALWHAQTPQSFRYGLILQMHEMAAQEGFLGTDDCSLLERYGEKVRIITGSYRNIKITTPEDLLLAEEFIKNPGGGLLP